MKHSILLLIAILVGGCGAGWRPVEPSPETVIPPRKQVLVYHGATIERWHATTIGNDSVSGIHWLSPIECDSCRVSVPRYEVDSMRVGDPTQGFVKSYFFTVYLLAPVAIILFCVTTRSCPSGT